MKGWRLAVGQGMSGWLYDVVMWDGWNGWKGWNWMMYKYHARFACV